METGYGLLSCQRFPGDAREWDQLYAEALDLTRLAESVGLDSVWTTEHHFVDDGYMPSLLVMSAAMAAVTERIKIGTGVVLAPLHDPLRLAEDAATVDLISRGRLILGLGLGWSEIEFGALGADITKRGRAMEEILQILPAAWSGEPITHTGEIYDIPEVGVRPTPSRPIPVVIGGSAEPAIRRAARYASGFFSNAPAHRLADQVAIAADEREQLGLDGPFDWTHYQYVYLADDPEEGWKRVKEHIHQSRWKYSDMVDSASRALSPLGTHPPLDSSTEASIRSSALVGPPEFVAEQIRATANAVTVDIDFVARSHFPGMSYQEQAEQVSRLGEELAPLLK